MRFQVATQALPSLAAFEQRGGSRLFCIVGTIIDDVGLKSLFVKDLFPKDDYYNTQASDYYLLLTKGLKQNRPLMYLVGNYRYRINAIAPEVGLGDK